MPDYVRQMHARLFLIAAGVAPLLATGLTLLVNHPRVALIAFILTCGGISPLAIGWAVSRLRRFLQHSRRRQFLVTVGAVLTVSVGLGVTAADVPVVIAPPIVTPTGAVIDDVALQQGTLNAMMGYYSPETGLFDVSNNSWWSAASDILAIIDADRQNNSTAFVAQIEHTYIQDCQQQKATPECENSFIDDTAWWGEAWLSVYQLTHDPKYLQTAEYDEDFGAAYWTTNCGGGVWWEIWNTPENLAKGQNQLNAITNLLYMELSVDLYNTTHQVQYLQRAEKDWEWFRGTGMLRPDYLVVDHIDYGTCKPQGLVWTYNQGVAIGALIGLYQATDNAGYLTLAQHIADASIHNAALNPGGIATDPCEHYYLGCSIDVASFKGIYVRELGRLNVLVGGRYTTYLQRNLISAYTRDQMEGGLYGLSWAGAPDYASASRECGILELVTAIREAPVVLPSAHVHS